VLLLDLLISSLEGGTKVALALRKRELSCLLGRRMARRQIV
jgi:hypothetical protein